MTSRQSSALEVEVNVREALLTSSTEKRRWSTVQLLLVCLLAVVVACLATNMDRIIKAAENEGKKNNDDDNDNGDDPVVFGHQMYRFFDFNATQGLNLNWGSFGGYPKAIRTRIETLNAQMEDDINGFYFGPRGVLLQSIVATFARLLNMEDSADLVLIDNASHGVNAVLRSLAPDIFLNQCAQQTTNESLPTANMTCKVIQFDTAYPMVPATLQYLQHLYEDSTPVPQNHVLTFHVERAMFTNTTLLVNALQQFIDEHVADGHTIIHAAIFSHITAYPAAILDAARLCAMFRSNDILCIVDGAHSLGQIHVNLTEMHPDVFIVTGYKWYLAPRGSALLYVHPSLQPLIYPTVISSPTSAAWATEFQAQFAYSGTKDDMPWFALQFAYDWRHDVAGGDDRIIRYLHDLSVDGGRLVADIWGTSLVIADEAFIPGMATVVFPTQNATTAYAILIQLFLTEGVYVRIEPDTEGVIGTRICAQIFLELSDYEWFAYRILDLLRE